MKRGTENLIKKLIRDVLFTTESVIQLVDFKQYFEEETLIRNIPFKVFYRLTQEVIGEILSQPE